ncbi:MAG: dienelactone hydrolase family protein [Cytophagales bacterium]|nr:dienelactone hydrolase family protein [Bernardetiaceae bacterium]MDW8205810.1 dienelactone hydrolase family protein [Cytophagales bacterium]
MLKILSGVAVCIMGAVAAVASYFMHHNEPSTTVCCQLKMPAISSFAAFASDRAFIDKHIEPLSFNFVSQAGGKMISYPTADGKTAQAWLIPAKKKSNQYLFVFHEWWGLNDHIKAEAEKFYHDLPNINVLCLDLYDGQVATTREQAAQQMQALNQERAVAIVKGAIAYAGKKANIFTIGWCMGGSWSLQTALLAGKQAKGCVMYYGMPERNVERLKTLQTDVLGIFAGQEQWISPKVVAEFDANMKQAGKQLTYKIFDADHAFANPSNPKFVKQAADEAYAMSLDYFRQRMSSTK